jgi:hypothetical protein
MVSWGMGFSQEKIRAEARAKARIGLFIDLVFWDLQEKIRTQSKIVDKGLFTKGVGNHPSIYFIF